MSLSSSSASVGVAVLDRLDDQRGLIDEESQFLAVFRKFVSDRIAPHAETYDQSSEFPWKNIDALHELSLASMFLPEWCGGSGCSYLCYLRIVEELSRGCPSTAITFATTFHALNPLLEFGSDELRSRMASIVHAGGLGALAITEESGGSDVRAMKTTITPRADSIVINGSKIYVTNAGVADFYLVFGKWNSSEHDGDQLCAVVVDKDAQGFDVMRKEDKMGHRASATAQLVFDDCHLPSTNLIGFPGEGLKILLYALNRSRPSIAAHALGMARAAIDEAVTHSNERKQFGHSILDFQGVQFMVADLVAKLALSKSWLCYVGRLVDHKAENYYIESSILKLAASDLAMEAATAAVQLHGGAGYMRGTKVERLFRDAKLSQIFEGANELHRQHIGRAFLDRA